MTFSPVAWAYKDPVTSAKLAQMVANVTDHDHRRDGTRGKFLGVWASGNDVESRSSTGWNETTVSFPAGRFSAAPDVFVEMGVGGVNSDTVEGIDVVNVTASSFTVAIYRTVTSNSSFRWTATERR